MRAHCRSELRADAGSVAHALLGEATHRVTAADALSTSSALRIAAHTRSGPDTFRGERFRYRGRSCRSDAAGRSRVETFVAVVRAPMQKKRLRVAQSFHFLPRLETLQHLTRRCSEPRAALRSHFP